MPAHLKSGDGVVFENLADTNDEQGGRIYGIRGRWLDFQRGRLRLDAIRPGMRVFKTGDQVLDNKLRQSFQGEIPLRKKQRLDLQVSGSVGTPLVISLKNGQEIQVTSCMPLESARQRPLTLEGLKEQLGRLGGTGFELGDVEAKLEGDVILPVSELNRMRRALVDACARHQQAERPARPAATAQSHRDLLPAKADAAPAVTSPELLALCRSFPQIEAALESGIRQIYVDFEDIRLYSDAVKRVREHGGSEVWLATPRIQKSGEAGFFKLIERAEPHGVLIRNLGAIAYFRDAGIPVTGDFSLNVANPLTAEFLKQTGLQRLTISYDLNIEQVLDLLASAPSAWFEITLHQHMPMFHMEHCAFAAFLSKGTDFTNCGRPCEHHKVRLRDRVGMEHPLKADVGCRNTLFNAVPQTGAQFFTGLKQAGLTHYRVELLEQDLQESQKILQTYQALLRGTRKGEDIWRDLKAQSQLGVTRGTMANPV